MRRKKYIRPLVFPLLFLLTLCLCFPKALTLWSGAIQAPTTPMEPAEPVEPEEPTEGPPEETPTETIPMEILLPAQPIEPEEPELPPEPEVTEPLPEPQTREEFFADALFIGDSRTVGLSEYGGLSSASYFCNIGMSVYSVFQAQCSVDGQSYTLESLLTERTFGKIHLMLGINELGYDHAATVKTYGQVVEKIRSLQPDAVLYLGANLHVDANRSQTDPTFNNANLDKFNGAVSELADGETIVYLDVNPLFDDGAGNLAAGYTGDGTHVYGSCYVDWGNWLYEAMCPAEQRE